MNDCLCCLSDMPCPCTIEHVTETNGPFDYCIYHGRHCDGSAPKPDTGTPAEAWPTRRPPWL